MMEVVDTFVVKKLEDGRFFSYVPSQSRAGKEFEVITDEDGSDCSCECEAFRWGHGKPCKHVKMVMNKLRGD
jgi:hypothetical protein